MSNLRDLMETGKGKYRAFFGGSDLGELASPPEIKADYDCRKVLIHDPVQVYRSVEGKAELRALITLKLRAVGRALNLLSAMEDGYKTLLLANREGREAAELTFGKVRLLPAWEFIPAFTGGQMITLKFSALADDSGRLFYFSET